jgi:hypothetical protein
VGEFSIEDLGSAVGPDTAPGDRTEPRKGNADPSIGDHDPEVDAIGEPVQGLGKATSCHAPAMVVSVSDEGSMKCRSCDPVLAPF